MGELHSSMAFAYTTMPSLNWDLQNLGVLTPADMSLFMDQSETQQFLPHLMCSDLSSGYLEDVLEFSGRSKKMRLDHLSSSNWDVSQMISNFPESMSTPVSSDEQINTYPQIKTPEEAISSSSSSKTKSFFNSRRDDVLGDDKRKRVIKRVVYPFALVKPGGIEGDTTLDDINERLMMPPTKPVRHPVGDFACRPCVSAHGSGLSGKAVVALTKLHTQGRGTITIMRTKG